MNKFILALSTLPIAAVNAASFDFYVYALSYQPEFCYNQASYPGCKAENREVEWQSQLTIHGMWPEFTDGSYPQTCSTEKFDLSIIEDMGIDQFYKAWPNVKEDTSDSDYSSFWEHEWTKHGTCSNLDQASFYKYTLATRPETPEIVGQNYGGNVTSTELQAAYPTDVVLDCQGTFLSQIFVCVGIDYKAIDCPASVMSESSCKDGTIMIAEFDDARR